MHTRGESAFTLVELLVYTTLVTVLLTAGWGSVLYSMQGFSTNTEKFVTQSTKQFLYHKFAWAVSGSTNVSVSASAVDFERPDLPTASNPLRFAVEDNTLKLYRGSGFGVPLTQEGEVQALLGTPLFIFDSPSGKFVFQCMLHKQPVTITVYR